MKSLAAVIVSSLFLTNVAFAQTCEERAVSKSGKPLHGAAKTAFMKRCEKGNAPADATAKAPVKTAQHDAMKRCNAEAKGKKGDERKAFMKECLSK